MYSDKIKRLLENTFPSFNRVIIKDANGQRHVTIDNDTRPSVSMPIDWFQGSDLANHPMLLIRHLWNLGYKEKKMKEVYPQLQGVNIDLVMKKIQKIKQ